MNLKIFSNDEHLQISICSYVSRYRRVHLAYLKFTYFMLRRCHYLYELRQEGKIMKILEVNPISVKKRMTELLFDYLLIITYLGILFLCAITYYYIVFNGVPMQTEFQAQTLTFFISVLPIMLYFTFLDYAKNGSFGKSKAGLRLVYQKKQFRPA